MAAHNRITRDDLVAFACGDMQGRLNDSIYNLIQTESERVGSPVQQWLQEFRAKCRDPLNVDWRRIALLDVAQVPLTHEVPDETQHGDPGQSSEANERSEDSLSSMDDVEHQPMQSPVDSTFPRGFTKRPLSMALGGTIREGSLGKSCRVTADDCVWTPARPSLPILEGEIDVQWIVSGALKVTVRGFLFESDDYSLEAVWTADDGSEQARGAPDNPFVPTIILTATNARTVQPGDVLQVTSVYEPDKGPGWKAIVRLPLLQS